MADGVAIPPAWTNVSYYGKSGENGIIAKGTDGKGRSQRVEDPKFRASKITEKHDRISSNLSPKIDKITNELRETAKAGNVESQVLYLITQSGFRIGGEGDGRAKEKAYGASNLTGDHVSVEGDTVTFDFPGKKGVRQNHMITDPVIADIFKDAEAGVSVFNTTDAKTRAAWKKVGGEKVHDIRSHVATQTAKLALKTLSLPSPKNENELNKLKMDVAKVVAEKLGNRPKESLATYINPSVFKDIL